jgi:hypothetical protein
MNFYTRQALPPPGINDVVCRLAVWGPLLSFLLFLIALLVGIGLFSISYHAASITGMIFSALYTLLLWVVTRINYHVLSAARSPANWLARIGPGGILLKYRSYLHTDSPEADPIALQLSWLEISAARLQKETHDTRTGNETRQIDRWFLAITLSPGHVDINKIESAITFENQRKPAHFRIGELQHSLFEARKRKAAPTEIQSIKQAIAQEKRRHPGKHANTWFHDRPVTFVEPDTLRMEWSHVTPGRKKLLPLLNQYTKIIADQAQHYEADKKMDPAEFEKFLAGLLSRNETIDAIKLIRQQTGCSLVEAKAMIERRRQQTGTATE